MKLLADMPISPKTVEHLRRLGFECYHLREFGMEKATDEEILQFAKKQGYTILTEDLDFGTILAYTKKLEPGVIILRVGNMTTTEINKLLEKNLKKVKNRKNCIIIIERTKIRIRKLH